MLLGGLQQESWPLPNQHQDECPPKKFQGRNPGVKKIGRASKAFYLQLSALLLNIPTSLKHAPKLHAFRDYDNLQETIELGF